MLLEMRTPVTIRTALSRTEIIDRLTRSTEPPGAMFPFFGPLGTVGRIGSEHCWFESGSFFRRTNRRLTLRYKDGANGTALLGEFAIPTLQLIPIIAVFAVGTLMCLLFGIGILKSVLGSGHSLTPWQLTPYILLFAAFLMLKFNLSRLHGSEKELVETLEDILKGPPASTDGVLPGQNEILIRPRHSAQ